jgi:Cu(I)/Ag(I) efflux system periplasmic protein CusF
MWFDIVGRRLVVMAWALASPLVWAQDTDGEVRRIDKAQSKITLKHGEIKNLDMPPMTMVFRLKDPKLLGSVAVGDKVKFAAEKIDGDYVVTQIVRTP